MRPAHLEIALKDGLFDPAGAGLIGRARDYFGLTLDEARKINVYTLDLGLTEAEMETVRQEILTNPVSQVSARGPLAREFDWLIWVGLRPGVKDNPGDTAKEAIAAHFRRKFPDEAKVYTSALYVLKGQLERTQVELLAKELLANDLVQRWRVIGRSEWDPDKGLGLAAPKVELTTRPDFARLDIPDDAALLALSAARSLALNPADVPVIRAYFDHPGRAAERARVGLGPQPTDVELEYLSQARSDHCNHNTFTGLFDCRDLATGERFQIDNLFRTCIKAPTLAIQERKDWVVSVLWDNAGAAAFDALHL
jgi:phosphoribosylformylglycinamidine synthase